MRQAAKELGIEVAGVSFHVGSGATNPAAFSEAIALAAAAFAAGAAAGHAGMGLLDIGGGFCGGVFGPDGRVDLGGVPAAVNAALAEHFPEGCGVRVIAEPGRCGPVSTLATRLFASMYCAQAIAAVAGLAVVLP